MEQLEKSTTSTSYGSRIDASKVTDFLRGRSEVHERVAAFEFKQLSQAVEAHTPELQDDYELLSEDEEQTRRGLGRRALDAVRSVDTAMAYSTAWAVNKFSLTQEEYETRRQERAEKYGKVDGDGWSERSSKFIKRNMIKIGERIVPYGAVAGLGLTALSRVMPYAAEGFESTLEYIGGPRTVTIDPELNTVQTLEVQRMAKATNFYIGGATDTTGSMFVEQEMAAGRYDASDNNVQANYSASIGPFVGQESMEQSTNEVIGQGVAAHQEAGEGEFTIRAFSEGTVGAVKLAQQLEASGADMSKVTVIIDGGPLGEMGIGNSRTVGAANPFLKAAGIDLTRDLPKDANVIVRSYSGDVWGASGNDSALTQGVMALGINSNHKPVDPSTSVLLRTEKKGNVTYEEWGFRDGPQHPLGRMAYDQGLPISDSTDNFLNEIVPVTRLGDETRYINAEGVSESFAVMADEALGNMGIAGAVEDVVMTPQRTNDLQSVLGLDKTMDRVVRVAENPALAAQEMPHIMNEAQAAMDTGMKYLNNPNEVINIINDGIRGAGIPGFQLPPMEQMQPVVEQFIPAPQSAAAPVAPVQEFIPQIQNIIPQIQEFIPQVAAPLAPAPAPVAPAPFVAPPLPPISPEIDQMVQQGMPVLQDFVNGLFAPRR